MLQLELKIGNCGRLTVTFQINQGEWERISWKAAPRIAHFFRMMPNASAVNLHIKTIKQEFSKEFQTNKNFEPHQRARTRKTLPSELFGEIS